MKYLIRQSRAASCRDPENRLIATSPVLIFTAAIMYKPRAGSSSYVMKSNPASLRLHSAEDRFGSGEVVLRANRWETS
ncbi:hypothetical protein RRG08_012192 [Elysia crispata]|uniref:Uncharacterized protein n=1 Tax=Elysia crispata TaxID=231223 RepID=A0AAE1DZL6_9GAST|nr:hypothetical protein RRG08_012192 [Elysia crispata]